LRDPRCYAHAADRVELIETHISWVLLAGDYAYKVKKPLALGFLDFSTLAARRACCEQELRLNRRTAPAIYLEVVPITGSAAAPRVGGTGDAIEYAVKMRRFPQDALASAIAQRGALGEAHADALAGMIARFHAGIAVAGAGTSFGEPAGVAAPALANFDQIEQLVTAPVDVARLERLRAWTQDACGTLAETFAARKRHGLVRECHGDLHLGNIAFIDAAPVAFDCIEFNEDFRWIDVMNEAAFLFMDLHERRLAPLAWRFLNGYLELTGDYPGMRVLRYYLVYRAMVRAKVDCIRGRQPGIGARARAGIEREYGEYLALAESFTAMSRPAVIVMHGLSGSGKTTVAGALAGRIGAVRVRSDVERKRQHGLQAGARSGAALDAGIYAPEATRATYERLQRIAREIIAAGFPVIVDAAFLRRADRDAFRNLAREAGTPFRIVSCEASEAQLRERILGRDARGGDASEAGIPVLQRQIETQEPLDAGERACLLPPDADAVPA
jgi:aminoglycoside phosphotransferase family enzyme/predicted kinase